MWISQTIKMTTTIVLFHIWVIIRAFLSLLTTEGISIRNDRTTQITFSPSITGLLLRLFLQLCKQNPLGQDDLTIKSFCGHLSLYRHLISARKILHLTTFISTKDSNKLMGRIENNKSYEENKQSKNVKLPICSGRFSDTQYQRGLSLVHFILKSSVIKCFGEPVTAEAVEKM